MKLKEIDYLSAYMDEYYGYPVSEENFTIGDFLQASTSAVPRCRILDVACGPSFYFWALFHTSADEICGLDARVDSLQFVRKELARTTSISSSEPAPQPYLSVAEHVVKHLAAAGSLLTPERYLEQQEHRVGTLTWESIESTSTSLVDYPGLFDVVTSVFGVDGLDDPSPEAFHRGLRTIRKFLYDGGLAVLVTLCDTDSWRCGEAVIPCHRTTEDSLRADLELVGFDQIQISKVPAVTAAEKGQGYAFMLFCTARKRSGDS